MVVTLFNFSVGVDDATWWDLGDESADFTELASGNLQTADHPHAQTVVFHFKQNYAKTMQICAILWWLIEGYLCWRWILRRRSTECV